MPAKSIPTIGFGTYVATDQYLRKLIRACRELKYADRVPKMPLKTKAANGKDRKIPLHTWSGFEYRMSNWMSKFNYTHPETAAKFPFPWKERDVTA